GHVAVPGRAGVHAGHLKSDILGKPVNDDATVGLQAKPNPLGATQGQERRHGHFNAGRAARDR
ncbi:hypothetical protein, partial [Ideonella azotifigens]|uniref:hypothetical protein n=1 Tax=Ideonella azotifigens TaxID=513160 RepID=UPI001B864AB3